MTFHYPDIPADADKDLFISQFNLFLAELIEYLNTREVLIPFERPQVPFEGQMMLAEDSKWTPAAGAGLYIYRSGNWIKIDRTSSYPVDAVTALFVGASPYTTVAGDITNPMTVWWIAGGTAVDITLHTPANQDRIGFSNISTHVATIHYGGGGTKTILLQPGESVSFQYFTLFGWLLV